MTNRNLSQARPEHTNSAPAPQLESLLGINELALEIEGTTLGGALNKQTMDRLALHIIASEQTPAVALAAAVQLWMDLEDDGDNPHGSLALRELPVVTPPEPPVAETREPAKVEPMPSASQNENRYIPAGLTTTVRKRTNHVPPLFSLGMAAWDVDTLAVVVAKTLSDASDFLTAHLLHGPLETSIRESGVWGDTKLAELAELVWFSDAVAVESSHRVLRGEEIPPSAFSGGLIRCGLAEWMEFDGQSLLESLAIAFTPWAVELARLAMQNLDGAEALPLIEALIVLEDIAGEWSGMDTDATKSPVAPTRLMDIAADARIRIYRQAA